MSEACGRPIAAERLEAYWLGDLAPAEEEALEEHLLGCAHCSRELAALAELGAGIRAAVCAGTIDLAISPALLERMKREGLRLREYRVAPGGRVDCTITAEDDAVLAHMELPLADVERVDMVLEVEAGAGTSTLRADDVPFDRAAGEVLHLPSAHAVRKLGAATLRIRLIARGAAGEKAYDYTLAHTPS